MTLRDKIKGMREEKTEPASEHVIEGEVHGIDAGYGEDEEMANLTIAPPAPKAGKGEDAVPSAPHVHAKIPKGHTGRFAVGDKVKLTTRVEKVTKGAD